MSIHAARAMQFRGLNRYRVSGVRGFLSRSWFTVVSVAKFKTEAANLKRHTYEAPNPSELNPGTLCQYESCCVRHGFLHRALYKNAIEVAFWDQGFRACRVR